MDANIRRIISNNSSEKNNFSHNTNSFNNNNSRNNIRDNEKNGISNMNKKSDSKEAMETEGVEALDKENVPPRILLEKNQSSTKKNKKYNEGGLIQQDKEKEKDKEKVLISISNFENYTKKKDKNSNNSNSNYNSYQNNNQANTNILTNKQLKTQNVIEIENKSVDLYDLPILLESFNIDDKNNLIIEKIQNSIDLNYNKKNKNNSPKSKQTVQLDFPQNKIYKPSKNKKPKELTSIDKINNHNINNNKNKTNFNKQSNHYYYNNTTNTSDGCEDDNFIHNENEKKFKTVNTEEEDRFCSINVMNPTSRLYNNNNNNMKVSYTINNKNNKSYDFKRKKNSTNRENDVSNNNTVNTICNNFTIINIKTINTNNNYKIFNNNNNSNNNNNHSNNSNNNSINHLNKNSEGNIDKNTYFNKINNICSNNSISMSKALEIKPKLISNLKSANDNLFASIKNKFQLLYPPEEISSLLTEDCYFNDKKSQITFEYLNDMYLTEISTELNFPPTFGYMKFQTDINEQMRAILIDWLTEVHYKFNMKEDTLFLCVNLIDRYMKAKFIPRNKLQLVGVAAMLIACKMEEIYSPSIKDFVFITDNAYQTTDINQMEMEILINLNFDILIPNVFRIYSLIALYFNFDKKKFYFGLYLLEIYLIDYRMSKFLPSIIACTAAYIVMKFFKMENYKQIYSEWNINGTGAAEIKDCAREICFLVDNIDKSTLKAAKRKFANADFEQVSLINFT